MGCFHSADWWRRHWGRTGILDIELADVLPDGWRFWLDWLRAVAPTTARRSGTLEADAGGTSATSAAVARRRPDVELEDPISSIPITYQRQPLLTNITRSPGPRTPPPKGTPA